ncbi:MAG: DUF131 domain-containing protein [Candidatus Bathyarchaeia archaeon]
MGLKMTLADLALEAGNFYSTGVIMILAGIIVIIVAFVLLFASSLKNGKVRGGGAVIIGPFPIIFGTDKESVKAILWLSITLTILLFILFTVLYLLR